MSLPSRKRREAQPSRDPLAPENLPEPRPAYRDGTYLICGLARPTYGPSATVDGGASSTSSRRSSSSRLGSKSRTSRCTYCSRP